MKGGAHASPFNACVTDNLRLRPLSAKARAVRRRQPRTARPLASAYGEPAEPAPQRAFCHGAVPIPADGCCARMSRPRQDIEPGPHVEASPWWRGAAGRFELTEEPTADGDHDLPD